MFYQLGFTCCVLPAMFYLAGYWMFSMTLLLWIGHLRDWYVKFYGTTAPILEVVTTHLERTSLVNSLHFSLII